MSKYSSYKALITIDYYTDFTFKKQIIETFDPVFVLYKNNSSNKLPQQLLIPFKSIQSRSGYSIEASSYENLSCNFDLTAAAASVSFDNPYSYLNFKTQAWVIQRHKIFILDTKSQFKNFKIVINIPKV